MIMAGLIRDYGKPDMKESYDLKDILLKSRLELELLQGMLLHELIPIILVNYKQLLLGSR